MKMCVLLLFLLVSCKSVEPFSGKRLYQKIESAAVEILVDGQRSGSGAFVSSDGYILTAAHVIQRKAQYSIMDMKGRIFKVKLIAADRSSDLALVKADIKPEHYLKVTEEDLEPAQGIYHFGAAFFRKGMMQKGWVSDARNAYEFYGAETKHAVEVRHVSTTVQPGTSGGPWVNTKGEIVGVQSGIMTINKSNSGMAFIAPITKIKNLLAEKK